MQNDIWKAYSIEAGEPPLHLTLGPLNTWIKRQDEEIWISYRHDDTGEAPSSGNIDNAEEISWSRWAHKSPNEQISITPVFPDRPIIVRSEFPLKIAPDSKIQIFTRIPVWMRVSLSKSNYILTEMPSVRLSGTWFGTPQEGELCYWLTTKARRNLLDVESKPFVVNCPIGIRNKASEDLNFEKFCFRVERLGVYLANRELWAGETQIVYHGEELNSDITMSGKLPSNLGKAEQMSKPRNPVHKSLATRTFKMLFDDTFISAR